MANVIKYSKDKIIEVSLDIVRKEGISELSARNIAKKLGSSVIPIFTYFNNMDDLKNEVIKEIVKIYDSYIEKGLEENSFKGSGVAYIKFAKENKNYFKVLFMNECKSNNISGMFDTKGFKNEEINAEVSKKSGLSSKLINKIRVHCWLMVHSIATMIVTNYCDFSDDEISEILTDEYTALVKKYKEES